MDHNQPSENGDGHNYQTETFVFTGNGGGAFLATMQNLMNRMIHGHQQQPPAQFEQNEHPGQHEQPEQHEHPEQHERPEQHEQPAQREQPEQLGHLGHPEQPQSEDADMSAVDDPPLPALPHANVEDLPILEPLSESDTPSASRPIRPLPRTHTHHFHAHTPGGVIDLFTFSLAGPPAPPPPGTATFTFNLGPDILAGFEAFFLGGMKDREPDPERARELLRGMEVVPEGLVRRLERAGGVPGGQGNEECAGCAVCWGPLLEEVEPGEWDTAEEKADKARMAADGDEKMTRNDDLHSRIVALPCAHVYHAECLLPWFSRNTTCPMCRFDVDPESLTWSPRPPVSDHPPPPPPHIPPEVPAGVPPPDAHDPNNPHTEHQQRANAINAARFNAFVNSIFRAGPFAQHEPPLNQPGAHPQQHPQPQQPQPQQPPQQPQPQQQPQQPPQSQPQSPIEPPNSFMPLPSGRRIPLIVLPPPPTRPPWGNAPNIPLFPSPLFSAPNAAPDPQAHIPINPFAVHLSIDEDLQNIPPPHAHPPQPPPPRRERRWTAPDPVGKTLRQRVEEKERELGLRCDDAVCGVAPSDEDPTPAAVQSESGKKRIALGAAYDAHGKACTHSFHPACLVTSARVAGVTGEEHRNGDVEAAQDDELQVACPACRAVGFLARAEWNEGVQASEAEMA